MTTYYPLSRLLLILFFCLLSILRIHFKSKYRTIKEHGTPKTEGFFPILVRLFFALPLTGATALFIINPGSFPWMYVYLPRAVSLGGVLLCTGSLALLYLTHRALGNNFSTTLIIRRNHHLIKMGPYRYIRHPMYVAYFLFFLGAFLLSRNWIIGFTSTAIILSLMTIRLKNEEKQLISAFGDDYLKYMAETGRFFPKTADFLFKKGIVALEEEKTSE